MSACSSPHEQSTSTHDTLTSTKDTIQFSPDSNTITINAPLILFTLPTQTEVNNLMAKDSDAYDAIVDDYTYYSAQLQQSADSAHIKTVSTEAHMLNFVTKDNKRISIDRSKLQDMEFATYIFNGIDSPKQAEIEMDKAFLNNYFKK